MLCRTRRQAPSMDTLWIALQEESGNQILTHYILRLAARARVQQNGRSQGGRLKAPKYFESTQPKFLCFHGG